MIGAGGRVSIFTWVTATFYKRLKRFPEYLDLLREKGPTVVLVNGVMRVLEKDHPELAERFLRRVIPFLPMLKSLRFLLAGLLYRKDQKQESFRAYQKACASTRRLPSLPASSFDQYAQLLKEYADEAQISSGITQFTRLLHTDEQRKLALMAFWRAGLSVESILPQIQASYEARSEPLLLKVLKIVEVKEQQDAVVYKKLLPDSKLSFYEPQVFGEIEERPLREVEVPACWIAELQNVAVVGSFAVVDDQRLFLYEPAARPHGGMVTGCHEYISGRKSDPDQVLLFYPSQRTEHLDEAILLSGRSSRNYFHWLIEYLPRAYAIHKTLAAKRVPLIIEENLAPQQLESLRILFGDWPVYRFDHQTLLQVGRLHVPSVATYLPDRFDLPYWVGAALSETHLRYLREKVFEALHLEAGPRPIGKRIYVSRRSVNARRLVGEEQLEAIFVDHGFELVCPEKMSFAEQVRLFWEADMIAGSSGAAFSNLIFCHPGSQVITLVGERNKTFSMYSNLARFAGSSFMFVTGPHAYPRERFESEEEYAHSPYVISEEKLRRALRELVPVQPEKRTTSSAQNSPVELT